MRRGFNRNRGRRTYDRMSGRYGGSSAHRGRINKVRVAGAIACLVLAIALVVLLIINLSSPGTAESDSGSTLIDVLSVTPTPAGMLVAPTPTPVPTPSPTPEHRKKAVALTFDDGPSRDNTPGLLDTLKEYGVHATFFVLGNRLEVDADILNREIEEGHEVGNHSWDHPQLSKLSMKEVNKQLDKTKNLAKKLTDGYEISIVRPPYGAISDEMRNELQYPMIFWSVDSLDWKYRDVDKDFAEVKKQVHDGAIILMHDIHAESCAAAKKIIPWLLEHDYDVLSVSELMERNGIDMKNGKVYASAE